MPGGMAAPHVPCDNAKWRGGADASQLVCLAANWLIYTEAHNQGNQQPRQAHGDEGQSPAPMLAHPATGQVGNQQAQIHAYGKDAHGRAPFTHWEHV